MTSSENGRIHTEKQMISGALDFSAAYMAVQYLRTQIESHPHTSTDQTIEALTGLIKSNQFVRQKQVLFLYSEAADTLVMMARQINLPISTTIIPRLQALLTTARGKRLRAIGQALGKLPITFKGPVPDAMPRAEPTLVSFSSLVGKLQISSATQSVWQGRSLVLQTGNGNLGVIKFATSTANAADLIQEALWMKFLNENRICKNTNFQVPSPVMIQNNFLFEITCPLPSGGPDLPWEKIAIAFCTDTTYFDYPNEKPFQKGNTPNQVKEIFNRNARLLGRLTSMGIYHTALIPLFHNRVQQGRRNDNGAYLWEHGGRLDQWLDSCRFPNFAASGLRDFEHLIHSETSGQLGHYIGEHLLGFVLVIGSFFRNQAPLRRGLEKDLSPCDTRDLFNLDLFTDLLAGVTAQYFKGISRNEMPIKFQFPLRQLVKNLIEAMGLDENMEEMLRIPDQQDMDKRRFKQFLKNRGITDASAISQGEKDIVLMTGPHLGGFNQPISIPGLTDFLFRFSSLCVSHCFVLENRLKP